MGQSHYNLCQRRSQGSYDRHPFATLPVAPLPADFVSEAGPPTDQLSHDSKCMEGCRVVQRQVQVLHGREVDYTAALCGIGGSEEDIACGRGCGTHVGDSSEGERQRVRHAVCRQDLEDALRHNVHRLLRPHHLAVLQATRGTTTLPCSPATNCHRSARKLNTKSQVCTQTQCSRQAATNWTHIELWLPPPQPAMGNELEWRDEKILGDTQRNGTASVHRNAGRVLASLKSQASSNPAACTRSESAAAPLPSAASRRRSSACWTAASCSMSCDHGIVLNLCK